MSAKIKSGYNEAVVLSLLRAISWNIAALQIEEGDLGSRRDTSEVPAAPSALA